ncbi:unnamed protein product (plasmid) [Mycetohabitans rhizoxinica HKI 454]|uniref:Uncharacterized protein n=1 Tax=Mycetohabitans rhizoxinica (strain DSM 19002 / CIP 109453 / HKI 454) TaxID=882378 RepID=E5AV78_MYCRK|nr:unnamed protein product [Mycetohabitans rhizoxinica HKI 454]
MCYWPVAGQPDKTLTFAGVGRDIASASRQR